MSFFGALLGGAMSGVGAGMASMGADEERLAEKRMLAQERHQQNLELQRQRSEDRMMQAEQLQAAFTLASRSEQLAEVRYRQGATGIQSWLDEQQKRRTAELALAENRLNQLNNQMQLFQALGGGS